MTTNPAERRRSAFPPDVTDLMPAARAYAAELADAGKDLSRNALMTRLHIGAPKARAVLAQLTDEATEDDAALEHLDTATDPVPPVRESRPLHLVPPTPDDTTTDNPTDTATDDDPTETAEPAGEPVSDDPPPAAPTTETNPDPTPEPDSAPRSAEPAPARRRVPVWPVLLLTLPALAAIWSGWVSLGAMAGFGVVHPLPGIADHVTFNTAITLPIGVETYAAYALWVWLARGATDRGGKLAKRSAIVSLIVGAAGQVTYHLLAAAHVQHAPWPVVTLVACLPVAVLGMGAALAHLVRSDRQDCKEQ